MDESIFCSGADESQKGKKKENVDEKHIEVGYPFG
jgi:hypothetical protein